MEMHNKTQMRQAKRQKVNNIMRKYILSIAVFLAWGCKKIEPYSNPYYTKEQLSVIETLCNTEWIDVNNADIYRAYRFYTIKNKPFGIFYTAKNIVETVDGICVDLALSNYAHSYLWHYFKLTFDDHDQPSINIYYIKRTSTTTVLDDIINAIPATDPNVLTTTPSPLQIWEEQGIRYISFYNSTYYSK